MKNILLILALLNCSFSCISQQILDKKLIHLDLNKNIEALFDIGLNRSDMSYMGAYLVNEMIANDKTDTLTLGYFYSKLNEHRHTELYQTVKSIRIVKHSPVESSKLFTVIDDYEAGLKIANENKKPILLVFGGFATLNAFLLKEYLIDEVPEELLAKFNIVWLLVDIKKDGIGLKNAKIQKDVFNTVIQPYSYIISNGEIIREFLGFSRSKKQKYLAFLKGI